VDASSSYAEYAEYAANFPSARNCNGKILPPFLKIDPLQRNKNKISHFSYFSPIFHQFFQGPILVNLVIFLVLAQYAESDAFASNSFAIAALDAGKFSLLTLTLPRQIAALLLLHKSAAIFL